MKTILIKSVTVATVLWGALTVNAYEVSKCLGSPIAWSTDNLTIRAGTSVSGSYLDVLEEMVDAWNDNPSQFQFDLRTGDNSVAVGNLQNEVFFTSSDFWLGDGSAMAVRWSYCFNWSEADILCDTGRRDDGYWTTSADKDQSWAYGGPDRTFHTTMLHELGHVLGLSHECHTYNIMGVNWNHVSANGSTQQFYPGEDACDGAVELYGLDGTRRQDVSVTHWRWDSCGGEYSNHRRTNIRRTDGVAVDIVSGTENTDPIYKVSKGHNILLEFTLENNGHSTQSPRVGFYLSSNDVITTWDDLLSTRRPGLSRNAVYTTTQQITIPSDLSSGQTYYLGIIVDDEGAIGEVNESNNATYVGIYIK